VIKLRRWFIDILIRLTERELYATPVKYLQDQKHRENFFVTLYELPGFKEHVAERETRIVHAQARKWQESVQGQRVENALLFQKAKAAYDRRQEALAREKKD